MKDTVRKLRDLRERFVFQGGSDFALRLADEIERRADTWTKETCARCQNTFIVRPFYCVTCSSEQLNALELKTAREARARHRAERDEARDEVERLRKERTEDVSVRRAQVEIITKLERERDEALAEYDKACEQGGRWEGLANTYERERDAARAIVAELTESVRQARLRAEIAELRLARAEREGRVP